MEFPGEDVRASVPLNRTVLRSTGTVLKHLIMQPEIKQGEQSNVSTTATDRDASCEEFLVERRSE